jgi:hypothetical protein
MAELGGAALDNALQQSRAALLPVAGDAGMASLATSQRFGPFNAGDQLVIGITGAAHVLAGDGTVAATVASPIIPSAGVYKFALPNGCTHVALIQSAAGAASGQAYKG